MNKHRSSLLRKSFLIACIIFFTAVCSDFSVRMFYTSTVWWVQVIAGLLAILFITLLIILLLLVAPEFRKAFLEVLGEK
jgi:hypothetical protein